MSAALVVLSTCADSARAEHIAETLVAERLAACVNLLGGLHSVYRWQGAVERAPETLLVIKCRAADYDALAARLQSLHPYAVPEILALPVIAGSADYLAWLERRGD